MRLGAAAEYLGLAAAVLAWVVIGVCVVTNPWFVFTKNAFSDLGGPKSTDPWLYNDGLIGVAVLVFLYAIYLTRLGVNKVEVVSASFVMVAAVFLALIGIYHEGTYPHVFVSTWFFVQFDTAILTSGIGLLLRGLKNLAYGVLSLFLIATLVAALVPWPSAATIEAWGISAIDVWAVLVFTSYRSKPKNSSMQIRAHFK
ncbi:hypothetical protein B9Q04_11890 [Candidatus Marsarchaeota G2 archaeon BE_D]|jgi:hypothetical membrane protein|uniref:DUF998 domain-containing protein n=1 Tax=Candidatus Marsarchaeota G2 archaeon BE_D TaxID=1978158 RepID=A0A2R6C8N7_9ARCH|nr:MAG: hypothetical protein B9Q04_11890 [Candidatus Marsarchaeota G2 archaeon BE_D]